MTPHDREVLETIAREVMGWKVFRPTESAVGEGPSIIMYTCGPSRCNGPQVGAWNPLEFWADAGEVLEKMQALRPSTTWAVFNGTIFNSLPPREENPLPYLTPRLITEAAYEAVEEAV